MTYDIAIVGGGIAGASLAAAIGGRARVLLLEAEDTPGYHATGRSAAFWSETYGGAAIQPLTTASHGALAPYLDPLGSLHVGRAEDATAIEAFLTEFADTPVPLERVDPAAVVPGLRADWTLGILEPTCAYIDVAAYHAACLAEARRTGTVMATQAELVCAERSEVGWRIVVRDGREFEAAVVVDAAGAWADTVAERCGVLTLGMRPYRRTVVQLATDPPPPAGLPMVADICGRFYFKPEAGGRLWLSPHDETPVEAHDVQPEELDIATAIDRFEAVVDWRVTKLERRWAGLRTFAPDRLPVYGFGAAAAGGGFFWFAGQGGFGIQTAPAAAQLAAALLVGGEMPGGVDPERYSPARFSAKD